MDMIKIEERELRNFAVSSLSKVEDLDFKKTPLYEMQTQVIKKLMDNEFNEDLAQKIGISIYVDLDGIELTEHVKKSLDIASDALVYSLVRIEDVYSDILTKENLELCLINFSKKMGISVTTNKAEVLDIES